MISIDQIGIDQHWLDRYWSTLIGLVLINIDRIGIDQHWSDWYWSTLIGLVLINIDQYCGVHMGVCITLWFTAVVYWPDISIYVWVLGYWNKQIQKHDPDLWPMTLTITVDPYYIQMHAPNKFDAHGSDSSVSRVQKPICVRVLGYWIKEIKKYRNLSRIKRQCCACSTCLMTQNEAFPI